MQRNVMYTSQHESCFLPRALVAIHEAKAEVDTYAGFL